MGESAHGCAHRICWTCGTQEGWSVKFCGPEGSSCVVNSKHEDLAESEDILVCCRPDMTDGWWADDCNGRLEGLLQETNIDVFLDDGFWPANVKIRKGGAVMEEMTGFDTGEVTVNIHPYITSDQLQPVAFKILHARDKEKKVDRTSPTIKSVCRLLPRMFLPNFAIHQQLLKHGHRQPKHGPELPCGAP